MCCGMSPDGAEAVAADGRFVPRSARPAAFVAVWALGIWDVDARARFHAKPDPSGEYWKTGLPA